ncbi:hypothetical protein BKA69DRAFT_1040483 [Paraphysoderma sedebokerense]|nr:hypothetical protein BKA69DRAFT_1040483 [Paraphysoderma sedebokerense]
MSSNLDADENSAVASPSDSTNDAINSTSTGKRKLDDSLFADNQDSPQPKKFKSEDSGTLERNISKSNKGTAAGGVARTTSKSTGTYLATLRHERESSVSSDVGSASSDSLSLYNSNNENNNNGLSEVNVGNKQQLGSIPLDSSSASLSSSSSHIPVAPLKQIKKTITTAIEEERQGLITCKVVCNDGSPESWKLMTGLKKIIMAQLPKMPKEYISKLIYDPAHVSLALVRVRDGAALGGIVYKPFFNRKFVEIVFAAVSSTEQVKGYGSHIMNHLKDHVRKTGDIRYFLTYADNYAIGYFKKQGFTTEITLDKSVWMGYIKDYEGANIMQCTLVPKISYCNIYATLAAQKAAIYKQIQTLSNSHIVYPGLKLFRESEDKVVLDPMSIPGVKESGWTKELSEKYGIKPKSELHSVFLKLLDDLRNHNSSWPFTEPVDGSQVPDYYQIIKEPMDLKTLEENIESDRYTTLAQFANDVQKIFDNCKVYNDPSTNYFKSAVKLEKYFKDRLKVRTERMERNNAGGGGGG